MVERMIVQLTLNLNYFEELNLEKVAFLDRIDFRLRKRKQQFRFVEILLDLILLDENPFTLRVGQLEIKSLPPFFVGNEKSFRGQKLTSICIVFSNRNKSKNLAVNDTDKQMI